MDWHSVAHTAKDMYKDLKKLREEVDKLSKHIDLRIKLYDKRFGIKGESDGDKR